MMSDFLPNLLSELGLSLTTQQINQFIIFKEELLNWNKKINLTGLTEEKEIIIKHFYDSLLGLKSYEWNGQEKVLDLGTGAGFPGIPLKIIYPSLTMVLVDSLQKRVRFLEHLLKTLCWEEVQAIHGRAEELGQEKLYREKFDLVVSRAVARLPVLVEYCLPFVQVGGVFLAYKGTGGQKEGQEAAKAIEKLGGKIAKLESFLLPEQRGQRTIMVIKKVKPTPSAYPRRPGVPYKKPL
ncbi:MAG TPA: 16S rRNA (guanine(527)-N(7))-methyltransferase RsmG [Clostridia bacterium]|nr:16S rRNA (guanine(527)-N(7))-methyltransferase RsmG [Clostridia bacterium]HHY06872.1 16S rRNA (guanine(527)-N(7))-methyltransferase RsmG [Clostridia bacterium]